MTPGGAGRTAGAACLAFLLASCSTMMSPDPTKPPGPTATSDWEQHRTQTARLNEWGADGKLSVRFRDKRWVLKFRWEQDRRNYRVDIRSAFVHVASIEVRPRGVKVRTRDGAYTARSPEDAAHRALGLSAPLSSLRHWILGVPSPEHALESLRVGDKGLAQSIEQGGWRVDYESYHGAEHPLPRKLLITKDDVKLVVLVSQWNI